MKKQTQSGQIIILFVMMLSTLVILLGMVISIGHLVQSKISLQNSVDLSAMSGASWQARFLNGISAVNFRMRQNYKWLLFDAYVTQSRFNGGFRQQVDAGGGGMISNPEEVFGICQQAFGYQPMSWEGGRGTSDSTDMCKNAVSGGGYIPPIIPSPAPTYNPIYAAINMAIVNLSIEARKICGESAGQNKAYFDYTTRRFASTNSFQYSQLSKVLSRFSTAFSTGLVVGGGVADATMLSTFRDNLLSNVKSGSPILYWLNPPATRTRNAGQFEKHDVRLFMNYVDFGLDGAGGCTVSIKRAEGKEGLVGFSFKTPNKNPVHITLAGVAQPNILFWPVGSMPVLSAIGAAKPFGSRIGPPGNNFEKETNSGMAGMANLFVKPSDGGRGMFEVSFLRELTGALPSRWSGRNPLRPTGGDFLEYVNSPTKYEGLFYNTFLNGEPEYASEALAGVSTSNGSYAHEDGRSGSGGWHNIKSYKGGSHYSTASEARSSWGLGTGRKGYQIKLISLPELCAEVDASQRGSLEELFCSDANMKVYH